MLVHDSALKHGIDPEDSIYAVEHALVREPETEEPPIAEFRLGFDTRSRLLELTVLLFDSGNEMIIHSMKGRPQYYSLLTQVAQPGGAPLVQQRRHQFALFRQGHTGYKPVDQLCGIIGRH